jgi:hypothetical protein
MGKLTTTILILSGIMLLFYFTGISKDCSDGLCKGATPNSAVIDIMMNPESIQTLPLWTKLLLALEGVGAIAGGIAIGYFSGGNLEAIIRAPIAVYLFNLSLDFLFVFQRIWEVNKILASVFFGPVILVYAIIVFDWWGKND